MQINVLIEPVANKGFRARTGEPIPLSVKAATRAEALAKVKEELKERLKNGAELVPLNVGTESHPWMEFAGMFKNDPFIKEWKQSVKEYRRKRDAEADIS